MIWTRVLFFPPIHPYWKKSERRLQWGHNDKVTVGMRCQQGFSEPMLCDAWKFYSGKEWAAEPGFHSTAMETALWDSASRPSETEASLPFLLQHPPPYHMPPTPHKWLKGMLRKCGPLTRRLPGYINTRYYCPWKRKKNPVILSFSFIEGGREVTDEEKNKNLKAKTPKAKIAKIKILPSSILKRWAY